MEALDVQCSKAAKMVKTFCQAGPSREKFLEELSYKDHENVPAMHSRMTKAVILVTWIPLRKRVLVLYKSIPSCFHVFHVL